MSYYDFACCSYHTHQVAHKAQIGHGKQSSENVEQHTVQWRHVNDHKVHVDCTNHQDDDASTDFPHPKKTCSWLDHWEIMFFSEMTSQ